MSDDGVNSGDYARPIFGVSDLAASLRYYQERLGFTLQWVYGGPQHGMGEKDIEEWKEIDSGIPDRPVIAEVKRNGIEIILDQSSSHPRAMPPSVICVELHDYSSLGKLHEQWAAAGARIKKAPFEVDWAEETLQLEVEDLDGNFLIFWGNLG